jgi:hypothetical protein
VEEAAVGDMGGPPPELASLGGDSIRDCIEEVAVLGNPVPVTFVFGEAGVEEMSLMIGVRFTDGGTSKGIKEALLTEELPGDSALPSFLTGEVVVAVAFDNLFGDDDKEEDEEDAPLTTTGDGGTDLYFRVKHTLH